MSTGMIGALVMLLGMNLLAGCQSGPARSARAQLARDGATASDVHGAGADGTRRRVSDSKDAARIPVQAESDTGVRLAAFEPGQTAQHDRSKPDVAVAGVPTVQVAGERLPLPPGDESADAAAPDVQRDRDLDFATALALAAGQNPRVAFAQQRIREAFAELRAAKVLWLPSIRAGISYNKHDGRLQNSEGRVLEVSRTSLQSGLGIGSVGTGTQSIPGISAQFHVADALFEPLIAQRTAAARQHAATAETNNVLLDTALSYLELLRSVQARTIAAETLRHARELADQTAAFAKAGQGPQADSDRARTELALRQNDVTRADEAVQIASARLAQVLSLDATLDLRPADAGVMPIDLLTPDANLNELVATALSNRPELAASRCLVAAAAERLRRERYAPWVPSVLLGLSTAGFGGGRGSSIDNYDDRLDVDALAFWEVRQFGFGEAAARDRTHAQVHQAKCREVQTMDQVAREVAEAFAQVQSRQKQIAVAKSAIKAAQASYQRNVERIHQGQGLPIEVLQAIQALDQAQREYLTVVTRYNEAQFRLQRAIGWPIESTASPAAG